MPEREREREKDNERHNDTDAVAGFDERCHQRVQYNAEIN